MNPASPAAIGLTPFAEKPAASPKPPMRLPRCLAPCACEPSSITFRSCSRAISISAVMSAGLPKMCGTSSARVRGVIRSRTDAGSISPVPTSTSENVGRQLFCKMHEIETPYV